MVLFDKENALRELRNYNGKNPYLIDLKYSIFEKGKTDLLTDFNIEYIANTYDFEPIQVNKTVNIADWYGEKLQQDYDIEFIPQKIFIKAFLGETKSMYHICFKYRRNMNYMFAFVSKKAILNDFLLPDYHDIKVDFDKYNNILHTKDPNRTLKPHQEEGVKFLLSRKKCILADEMGLGKTTELSVAAIEGDYDAVLIICPASLKTNWKKELEWFVPEKDISIIDGYLDKNKAELEAMLGYAEGESGKNIAELKEEAKQRGKWRDNRFVIVNYDILNEFYKPSYARSDSALDKLAETYPLFKYLYKKNSLIIIDEAHSLSNSTSDRYKLIKNLIDKAKPNGLFLSTGTPITNHPDNYYNLLKLLNDPITDDWNYYMMRYCDARKIPAKGEKARWTGYYLNRVHKNSWYDLTDTEKSDLKNYIYNNARLITINTGASNLDELKNRTAHVYLRRTKEDLGKLPNKHIHCIMYDFTAEQLMQYNQLWDEYVAEKTSENPSVEINKELLEGAVYRKYCSNEMIPNTEALTDKFVKQGEKVVIVCCYDEELYTLQKYYGDSCVIYNGKMSLKEKDAAKDAFMTNPDIKVFIGNIIAAGVGITLTSSHIMVWNNLSYLPSANHQMEDRIYRIGQTKDCEIYYQMFRDTEYEKIWNTVLGKQMNIDEVIKKESDK